MSSSRNMRPGRPCRSQGDRRCYVRLQIADCRLQIKDLKTGNMKTKAVRIYGKDDLRLEEFELPPLQQNEILAQVICDSLCMSSYKATRQGAEHKRIPHDIHIHPTIIGHEFSG